MDEARGMSLAERIHGARTFGERMRVAREIAGLSRYDAARLLDITMGRLLTLECVRDERVPGGAAHPFELMKAADLYGVMDYWLREGEMHPTMVGDGYAGADQRALASIVRYTVPPPRTAP